jgi:hypothetical protein
MEREDLEIIKELIELNRICEALRYTENFLGHDRHNAVCLLGKIINGLKQNNYAYRVRGFGKAA